MTLLKFKSIQAYQRTVLWHFSSMFEAEMNSHTVKGAFDWNFKEFVSDQTNVIKDLLTEISNP